MGRVSRRRFLAGAGAAAATAAVGAACSDDDDGRRSSPPPSTTTVEDLAGTRPEARGLDAIEHVVILMQENRSFDHYFGTMAGVRGFADPTPVRRLGGDTLLTQPWEGRTLRPFRFDTTTSKAGCPGTSLPHSWFDAHQAANAGRWDAWTAAKTPVTLGHFTRDDIPFHHALADAFTICDRHFCSTLAGTNPNRLHLWTGTIDAEGRQGGPAQYNDKIGELTWTTYPERLEAAGVSWQVYQEEDDFGDNPLEWFPQYLDAPEGSALWTRGVQFRPDVVEWFADDVREGDLPRVSWIVAPAADSEHPGPSTPWAGGDFTHRVLDVLAANPDVWAKTLFLLTYDENDGYYDHLAAPIPPPGTPGEYDAGGTPVGLGPRVPLTVISPFSAGGAVCSETLDHTSAIRFLERWLDVDEPNISEWRRAVCGDLTGALDLSLDLTAFPDLPETATAAADAFARGETDLPMPIWPDGSEPEPTVEPGTRPALPLPYRPMVRAGLGPDGFAVVMENRDGARPVTFEVHSDAGPVGVTSYLVTPEMGAAPEFPPDAVDLSVHGPDGFLRTFRDAALGLEVNLGEATADGVTLTLVGPAGREFEAVITPTAIVAGGPWTVSVVEPTDHVVPTNQGWYDVTVTLPDHPQWERRLAGHVDPMSRTVSGVGLTA